MHLTGRLWKGGLESDIHCPLSFLEKKQFFAESFLCCIMSGEAVISSKGRWNKSRSNELNWSKSAKGSPHFHCAHHVTLSLVWVPFCFNKTNIFGDGLLQLANIPGQLSTKLLERDFNGDIFILITFPFKKRSLDRIPLNLPNIFHEFISNTVWDTQFRVGINNKSLPLLNLHSSGTGPSMGTETSHQRSPFRESWSTYIN